MDTIQIIIGLLNEKNISGAKMRRDLGFSNAVFSQWKSGKQKPSMDKIQKIADYFHVSTDYLLGKTDVRATKKSDDVTFDDFTYALYNESQELDDDAKEQLLDMARFLKQKIKERDSK